MSDLRNWEKNNGDNGNNGVKAARRGALELLSNLLKTKKAGAVGACAALLLAAGSSFAAENGRSRSSNNLDSIPVASSSWTSPSGRAIVDLKAKSAAKVGKRAQYPIRQTQALTPAPVSSPEFSEPLLDNGDLLAPPADPEPLADPSTLDAGLVDAGTLGEPLAPPASLDAPNLAEEIPAPAPSPAELSSGTIEEIPTAPTRLGVPSETLVEETIPAPTKQETGLVPEPLAPVAPVAPSPEPRETPSIVAEDVPKAPVATPGQTSQNGSQNAFYGGVSEPARPSNNPYARIGQAEYHPSQFYGGYAPVAGNAAPPTVAYGQNLWGEPTPNVDCPGYWGCCGFLQNVQLEAGAFAMRNPLDFEDSGNFGAQFALNWASVRPLFCGLNVQAGARATQLDFNGTEANGFVTDDARTQVFWTAGVFFRAPVGCNGWSAGVVYDSLIEDYYRQYELSQLRAELSYSFGGLFDLGFRGAFALNEDDFDFLRLDDELTVEGQATATSYYTMFLRTNFDQGAQATVFGGVTEWSEAIVGATLESPLTESLAIKGGATYIIPTERGLGNLRDEETWNVSAGVVWYLGGGARANACGETRPLFDVADNGTFLQNFLR
ncbi:MAG: hypothetical protein IJO06_00440 [Thermoguttaceae bacterium]|nr:hypothetical protein [Thermoguttaceae bacterium]